MSFAELYDLHSQPVFRFLFARTRDRELAEDLLQDVFAWAWIRPPEARLEDMLLSDQRSRLMTKARSALIDDWRHESRRPTTIPIADVDQFVAPEPIGSLGLLEALDRLRADRREILVDRYFGGMPFKVIAENLGCLPKTANERFRVARDELLRSLRADKIAPSVRSVPHVDATERSLHEGRVEHEL